MNVTDLAPDKEKRKTEPVGNGHTKGIQRILLYSHDTFGLGNIRRMLAVAAQLAADGEDRHILLITGSPVVQGVDMPGHIEWLKLPGLCRDVRGEYRVRSLPLARSRVLALRAELIRCAVEAYSPDLVMVDKSPSGVEGEFMAALKTLATRPEGRPPTVLLLRDILDDGAVTRRLWERRDYHRIIADHYDLVLVAGQPDLFDVARHYGFPESTARHLRYCGYIRRPELSSIRPSPRSGRVVVTPGGGGDGTALLQTYLTGLAQGRSRHIRESLIVMGPEMDNTAQETIRTLASRCKNVELITYHREIPRLMAQAAVLVCMCGYNTICESLALGRPVVTIPRIRPVREQIMRAHAFAARGWLHTLHPDEFCPASLLDAVDKQLARPLQFSADDGPDFGGLDRIAYWVHRLLAARAAGTKIEDISAPAFWPSADRRVELRRLTRQAQP